MASVKKNKDNKGAKTAVQMHFVVGDPNFPNGINYHTHGLPALYKHPDLQICLPIQPDLAKRIFNAAIARIAKGETLSPGLEHNGILKGFTVRSIEAQEWGRIITRLILPDENGRFDTPYYQEQSNQLDQPPHLDASHSEELNNTAIQKHHQKTKDSDIVMLNLEIRQVPASWQHPRDKFGKYIPMFESYYPDALDKWWKQHQLWEKRRHPAQLDNPSLIQQCPFYADYAGDPPSLQNHQRVQYSSSQKDSYQVYETVTEGTPISPVFADIKAVKIWLIQNWGHPHSSVIQFCRAELERLGQDPQKAENDGPEQQQPLQAGRHQGQGNKNSMDPLNAAIQGGLDDAAEIDRPIGGKKARLTPLPRKRKR